MGNAKMTSIATMDFETYSEAGYRFDPASGRFVPIQKGKPGIKGINAAVYSEHPSTEVISLAYELPDGKYERLWIPGMGPPQDLFNSIAAGGLVEAHNSGFEYYIWANVCYSRMGWPPLPLRQLRCSAAKARASALPGALGKLSEVLNPAEKKNKRGKKLIQLLSIPKKPAKKDPTLRRTREAYPELYAEMYQYNIQDIVSEKAVSSMVPELPPRELDLWLLDQRINTRGVAIDIVGLKNCIAVFKQAESRYTEELKRITGGMVSSIGEMTKNSAGDKWMITQGVGLSSLDKEHVGAALERDDLPPAVHRALEIRQIIGSASVKKLFAIERMVSRDGRLRDLFSFCGASRTGRWSGSGSQPQNLKNSGPDCVRCDRCGYQQIEQDNCFNCGMPKNHNGDLLEWGNTTTKTALVTMATQDLDLVEAQWGNAVDTIASCMRGLFVAAHRYDLICSDYSAIEARVLAAVAGEEWRMEVFRTHGKIYEASASKLSGVPLKEILDHKIRTGKHHPLRKKGKVNELANGYSGWINASKAFGADKYSTDDEIKQNILKWREESPAIVELWGGQWRKTPGKWEFTPGLYGIEGAAIMALQNPGKCFGYNGISYGHDPIKDALYCLLPSGRKLTYHQPRLTRGIDPRKLEVWNITFMGWNSSALQGPVGWHRRGTYGGRLVENLIQAISRDILRDAMLRLDAAGYPPVLHVHDEVICEVPEGFGSVEEFERIMMAREPWFADWPIKAAGGWRGKRYRK
jgi:DNA polymerase